MGRRHFDNIPSILMIDADVGLCTSIEDFFTKCDFCVDAVHDGASGLAIAVKGKHVLILLDVMLPVLDGFQVLQNIRQHAAVPVIVLTARSAQQYLVASLNAGADDYIAKAFEPHELVARVRAVLRRSGGGYVATEGPITVGNIVLNPRTCEVRKATVPVVVTSVEFDVLAILMRSAGRVVSRTEFAMALYNREITPRERSIDVHISHLRQNWKPALGR